VSRWLKRIGLGLLVVVAVLIFGWVPYWLAGRFTFGTFRPPDRENAGKTPATFEVPFQEVEFQASDGVPLKGWWAPASENRGTVVMLHGFFRSRIEMVAKVPFVHGLGWNALLFDLRHHGESGGRASTFGYLEREDARAAIALARTRSPAPVVLWGVSLGGATATLAAADDPTVAGLVCDSSFRSLRDTVPHHLRLFRNFRWYFKAIPTWPVANEVVYWFGKRGGFDPDAVDIVKAARRLAPRPVLFVANSGDPRMPKEIAFELKAAAGPGASVLVIPSNTHGGAYREGQPAYESAVKDLLASIVDPATGLASPHASP
jgi:pimeloyl-ACP methyl ester carboxylesterase